MAFKGLAIKFAGPKRRSHGLKLRRGVMRTILRPSSTKRFTGTPRKIRGV